MTERERRIDLDIFRIILTLLVVLGHANYIKIQNSLGAEISWCIPENISVAYYFSSKFFKCITDFAYSFHMPAFFILSGYLFHLLNISYDFDSLILKKLKRLIVPYFMCGVFFTIPCYFLGSYLSSDKVKQAYTIFLNGGCCDTHLWFLFALFWCFVLFYPLHKFIANKSKAFLGLILVISYFIPKYFNFFCFYEGLHNLLWFGLGYSICFFEEHNNLWNRIKNSNKYLFIFTVLTVLFFYFTRRINLNGLLFTRLFVVVFYTSFIYLISYRLSNITNIKNSKLINELSKYSMAIYLYHDPLNYIILRCFFEKIASFSYIYMFVFCYSYIWGHSC